MTEPTLIPIKKIVSNPYQPRTTEDAAATAEIAINIYRNGLLQIPSARSVNGHYELVFGHTRKAAYELLATQGVPSADIAPDKRFAEMPLYIHTLDDKQMFEMAVAENIKRRDLNPIEQAIAMKRYMNDFEATSKQAAELFGVNDATVRGKVRLLELPKAAQDKLSSGDISEGTARALLSLKRISSDQVIVDTVKKIEKSNGRELPEAIMEEVAERLDNVVEMWVDGHGDGKPRASQRAELWHLDMQNFPNERLTKPTAQELGSVLSIQDKKKLSVVAEWSNAYVDGMDISDLHLSDEQVVRFKHLHNPTACNTCPFYSKVRGSHYCGLKTCHARKVTAWTQEKLDAATKSLKIEIYNSGRDGKSRILDSYGRDEALFTKRHKDLRLIAKDTVKGHAYQHLKGVDDDFFFVVATKAAFDNSTQTVKGTDQVSDKERDKERIRKRQVRLFRTKQKELTWEFTLIGRSLFESLNYEVLRQLDDWKFLGMDDQPDKELRPADNASVDVKIDHVRRLLVLNLLVRDFSYFTRIMEPNLVSIAKKLESYARKWGVKFPKSIMKMAEQGDAEIKSLAKATVSTATKKK